MNNINIFFKEIDSKNEPINETINVETNIQKMIDELNNSYNLMNKPNTNKINNANNKNKLIEIDDSIRELYLNDKCTIKDLLKICNYYNIEKDIKTSKCKKQDIISTILFFESLPENEKIVQNRYKMWTYMTELTNDPKMKKYIIW